MKTLYLLILTCIVLLPKNTEAMQNLQPNPKGDTSYRIIRSEANSFGYEILVNNKLLIRQPNIPGLPGNNGFVTKADAAKTAQLVIKKLKQGVMPPTITTKELDSMKVQLPHF